MAASEIVSGVDKAMADTVTIRRYLEQKRFVEVLYFGALELVASPTAELHLALGLACCATCKPIAEAVRTLRAAPTRGEVNHPMCQGGLLVKRDTLLVNEGLHHLLTATRQAPALRIPTSLESVTTEILRDLQDYLREEFRDLGTVHELGYDFRAAASAAIVLLSRLQGVDPAEYLGLIADVRLQVVDELLAKLSTPGVEAAAFYAVVPPQQ